jgi:hypothetical protein
MEAHEVYFFISYGVAMIVFTLIARWYVWPAIRQRSPKVALTPLLLYACLRINGLMFLVPGLVSPDLPEAFARPTAYGDAMAAGLALLALWALRTERTWALILVWAFNIEGLLDLLYANVSTFKDRVDPASLGSAYYLAVINVPAMLVVHVLIFVYLVRNLRTLREAGPVPQLAGQ